MIANRDTECVGGPSDERFVDSRLGDRWPDVIIWYYGQPSALIGDYILEDGKYVWHPASIREMPVRG